jgi:hypothetical protein
MFSMADYQSESNSHEVNISGNQLAGIWALYQDQWWSAKFHFIKLKVLENREFSDANLAFLIHYPWNIDAWGRPISGLATRSLPDYDNSSQSRRRAQIAPQQNLYFYIPFGWQYQFPMWPNQILDVEYRLGQIHGPRVGLKNNLSWSIVREIILEWERNQWSSSNNELNYSTLTLKIGLSWPDSK